MSHHHFLFNPPISHSTYTLKLACILLYDFIVTWLTFGLKFWCPIQCIIKQFLHHLTRISEKVLKIIISMCAPLVIYAQMLKYAHIMVWPEVVSVYVNEQALVATNHCVVHRISIFVTIKPTLVQCIFPWFLCLH